jgi:hypothetical protein
VACENCHGSTHAERPNADSSANDNVASVQLQGHAGVIIECTACHGAGTLGTTINGPHGLHPINDARWVDHRHESAYENNRDNCRACHGTNLAGTALSSAAADRTYNVEDRVVRIAKGQAVSCTLCHGRP